MIPPAELLIVMVNAAANAGGVSVTAGMNEASKTKTKTGIANLLLILVFVLSISKIILRSGYYCINA